MYPAHQARLYGTTNPKQILNAYGSPDAYGSPENTHGCKLWMFKKL